MILFDMDGTLIDSNGIWQEVDHVFLSAHGLESTDDYLDVVGHSIFPIAAQFTKDYYHLDLSPEQIMEEWRVLAKDAYEHHIPLKPGVKEYLTHLTAQGETLAIVSACSPELGYAVLSRHNLIPFFQHIVFAQEMGLEKRHPDFFQRVLEHLSVSAQECTFFDDAPDNCIAAKAAGMTVIGMLDPLYENQFDRIRQICDHCIHDFTELLP